MPQIGLWEILIIVLVIVVIFGAGRIAKAGGELGKGIKAFKDGLQGKDEAKTGDAQSSDKTDSDKVVEEDPTKADR